MSYLKSTLSVKRTTTNWAVLRECGHEPLQFYWFRSVVKMCNSMLRSNSETLRRVLKADWNIHSREPACWTAQVLDVSKAYGAMIPLCKLCGRAFLFLFKNLLMTSGTDCEQCGEVLREDTYSKLATYQSLFAVPFDHNVRAPA
eukprot:235267-Pelagomonas_calceolata.AAC.1